MINIIIKDTTIKEDIDDDDKPQTAKPSRKTASKKALISRQDGNLPAPQAFQNVHFLQC